MKAHITPHDSASLQDLRVEPQAEVLPRCLSVLMSSIESVKPGSMIWSAFVAVLLQLFPCVLVFCSEKYGCNSHHFYRP